VNLPASIRDLLRRLDRRRRVNRALNAGLRALGFGFSLLLISAVAADLLHAGPRVYGALAAGVAVLWLVASLAAYFRRSDRAALARLADRRAKSADVFASALAFAADAAPTPFMRLSLVRAAVVAESIDPRLVLPYRLNRNEFFGTMLLGFAAAAWIALSPLDHRSAPSTTAIAIPPSALSAAAEDAAQLAADAADAAPHTPVAAVAREMQAVIREMQTAAISPDEALSRLAAVESLAAQAGDVTWIERVDAAVRAAGQALRGAALTDEAGRRLEHGRTLEAEKALRRAAEQARAGATSQSAASHAASADAARRLTRAADALQTAAPHLAARLNDAAAELDARQSGRAAQRLHDAADDLAQLDRQRQEMRLLRRADEQIAQLKGAVRAGLPPQADGRWAALLAEVPESLRRLALPSANTGVVGQGEAGIGAADLGSGLGEHPTRLEARYAPTHAPGQVGDQGATVARVLQGVAAAGPASVEYRRVFAEYQGQVEEAIAAERVPLTYRFYVRRYFQTIRPE
jgi:hypothetical protein